MAVRHRNREQLPAPARPGRALSARLLSGLLVVVALVALLVSIALFIGEMTASALVAAVVCVAAGWGHNRVAARSARRE